MLVRRFSILIALALAAGACAGSQSSLPPAAPPTTVAGPADATTSTVAAPPDAVAPARTPAPVASRTPAPLPASDYPDVVVADLAGGEVNLRRLALETQPVLLWFWAPH